MSCFVNSKKCKVTGIDLSLRMLDYARQKCPSPGIELLHLDATDLSHFADNSFDFATMLVFIHELNPEQQKQALREAFRIANKVILVDSVAPLPRNIGGLLINFVEYVFGREHKPQFKRFLTVGGIRGVLKESGLPHKVEHSSVFWKNSRELVMAVRK